MATHEPVVSHRKVAAGSDRSFGLVFAGFFAVVALLPMAHGGALRLWALALAAAVGSIALAASRLLHPFNKLWFRFGLLLHHLVSPVVMTVMFYGAILPVALVLRAMGKDPLSLKRNSNAASYWIRREPPAPEPGSMQKQF